MKRFNPIATPGSGSGATVTVAPEEVETRPVPNYGRHRRWRHPPPVTRHFAVITLTKNAAQNGLQIYFPGKPDETLRTEVVTRAHALCLPVEPTDIQITREGGKQRVRTKYVVKNLSFYPVDLHLQANSR